MREIELLALRKLRKGPVWAQSLKGIKPVLARLLDQGLVCRVKPEGGRSANMFALTDKGIDALERNCA